MRWTWKRYDKWKESMQDVYQTWSRPGTVVANVSPPKLAGEVMRYSSLRAA